MREADTEIEILTSGVRTREENAAEVETTDSESLTVLRELTRLENIRLLYQQ